MAFESHSNGLGKLLAVRFFILILPPLLSTKEWLSTTFPNTSKKINELLKKTSELKHDKGGNCVIEL